MEVAKIKKNPTITGLEVLGKYYLQIDISSPEIMKTYSLNIYDFMWRYPRKIPRKNLTKNVDVQETPMID